MTELLIALCAVFLAVMAGKVLAAWPSYKGTVYQRLFGSYLEYFWKYSVNQDLSQSGYLASELGSHRLLYNAYHDTDGREACQFVTVVSTRGIVLVCVEHTTGKVIGSDKGPWRVEYDDMTRTLASPLVYVRKQQKFISKAVGKMRATGIVVFDDGAELTDVTCNLPVIHANELLTFLKDLYVDAVLSEQEVEEIFEKIKTQMAR